MNSINQKEMARLIRGIEKAGMTHELNPVLRNLQQTGNLLWKRYIEEKIGTVLSEIELLEELDPLYQPEHELKKAGIGDIPIGVSAIDLKSPISLGVKDFRGITSINGWTQKGKSKLSHLIQDRAMPLGYVVWSFDTEVTQKGPRGLIVNHPKLLVISLDKGQDRDNYFESPCPQYLPHKKWVPMVVEELARQFFFLDAGKSELTDIVLKMMQKTGYVPSVRQVARWLDRKYEQISRDRRASYRMLNWLDTLRNRMKDLDNQLGENINCNKGYNFTKLVERSIIWEMKGFSNHAKNVVRSMKALKLYQYRLHAPNT